MAYMLILLVLMETICANIHCMEKWIDLLCVFAVLKGLTS